jgi:hypothetical protein
VHALARVCLTLGILWALLIPTLAFADDERGGNNRGDDRDDGRSCSGSYGSYNPQCAAPEVPMAVLYPALGGLSFVAVRVVRGRRRADGE